MFQISWQLYFSQWAGSKKDQHVIQNNHTDELSHFFDSFNITGN